MHQVRLVHICIEGSIEYKNGKKGVRSVSADQRVFPFAVVDTHQH